MIIPKYLRNISELVNSSSDNLTLKIKCSCGFDVFDIFKYEDAPPLPKKLKKHNEIIRENDKTYLIKRNFFGVIVSRIEYDPSSIKKQRRNY